MGTKAESEHNLYRFLKVFTKCYQKQDDINFFFLISKAFQVYRTAARTVQKTHVLFYLNSPSFNILLQLKSVLNCSFGASGNMSAIQPLEAFSAYESKRKQNLTKPVYWSKSANPGPKDNSTPTHSWLSTRTSQEDTELFKTRLPRVRKTQENKKTEGQRWLALPDSHTYYKASTIKIGWYFHKNG